MSLSTLRVIITARSKEGCMSVRKHELVDWDEVFRRLVVEAPEPLPNNVIARRIGMTTRSVADALRAFEARAGAKALELRARRRPSLAESFAKRASQASRAAAALPAPTSRAADWSW